MKLAALELSTQESVLAVRQKVRQLTLSVGATAVEATRFATGVSQLCRDALRLSPTVTVEFRFDFEHGRGLSLSFSAPKLGREMLADGLFDTA